MAEHEDLRFTLRRPPIFLKHTCSLSTRGAETDRSPGLTDPSASPNQEVPGPSDRLCLRREQERKSR